MEVVMSRETDWAVLEKAVEITASAVRGAMGTQDSQPPEYVGEVFRAVYAALKETADSFPERTPKAGF